MWVPVPPILLFDDERRIVTHDNFFDQLSFLVLGVIEPPACGGTAVPTTPEQRFEANLSSGSLVY